VPVDELPISAEAVEAAAKAQYEGGGQGYWEKLDPEERELWLADTALAIQGFLAAEGFEVEHLPSCGCKAHLGWTEQRLVSPWKPIPEQDTDTPSTTGEAT
jgi:hypothetical protein